MSERTPIDEPPELTVHLDSPEGRVASWCDVVIVDIRTGVTVEMLNISVAANRSVVQRYPLGVGSLNFAHTGCELPNAAVRRASQQSILDVQDTVRCAATVLGGSGFWASAARSVMTAMNLLGKGAILQRTFPNRPDAVSWMAVQMGHDAAWRNGLLRAVGGEAET